MNMKKFWQWLSLQEQVDKHAEIAHAALTANDCTDKVVNRHLNRIYRRESDIEELCMVIAEAPVFNNLTEEE